MWFECLINIQLGLNLIYRNIDFNCNCSPRHGNILIEILIIKMFEVCTV